MVINKTQEKRVRELAEKLSLEMPGNWPDDHSQKLRIEHIKKVLLSYGTERHNEALEKAALISRCSWGDDSLKDVNAKWQCITIAKRIETLKEKVD